MTRLRQLGTTAALFTGLMALVSAPARAQIAPAAGYTPPDDTPSIKVGAVIYADYTVTKEPTSKDADGNTYTPSAFNVTRSYLNFTGNVSHVIAFRITPDITRDSDTGSALTGNLVFRIKYAFAQINMDDWTGNWKGTWVRLGIQQTPYIDYAENIYRYRFQGTTFTEREQVGGNLTSSDAGVSFHTGLPNNYGEVHVGYYNGEGYSKAEANDQKAFQVRGTLRPFASGDFLRGLRITAFYDDDHYVKDAPRTRVVFAPTFEHTRFNAGFEYLNGTDQTSINASKVDSEGWSFWVTPFFKEKGNGFEALVRYDHFKPNTTTLDTQHRERTIAGVSYWFPHPGGAPTAALLLDFEQVKFDNFPATPANATQQRIAVHGLINF